MKKRTLAFVLVLAMLLGLLPVAVMAAAPAAPFPAFLTDGVTVDGSLEEGWLLTGDFDASAGGPAGKLGVQWDAQTLYLAVEAGAAEQLAVTLGTVTAVYDMASGTFTPAVTGAAAAVSGTKAELALPFAAFGVAADAKNQKVDFAAELRRGEQASVLQASGLELRYEELLYGSDLDNYAADGFVSAKNTLLDHGTISIAADTASGSVRFVKAANPSSAAIKGIGHAVPYTGGPFSVEYTVKLNDLPVVGNTTLSHWRGFVFELDHTYRYRYSLTRDGDNHVLFSAMYFKEGDSNGVAKTVDTGLLLGDTATVRACVDEENVLRVYINGTLLQTMEPIDQTTDTGSDVFEFYVNYADIVAGGVDVELFDVAVSKPAPAPALGASVYLAEEPVTVDGALSENWLMRDAFENAAGKLGAQWDTQNLYLAVEAGAAEQLALTLGSVSTVLDLASGSFTPAVAGAAAAVSGTQAELALPLAACGITARPGDQNVTFTAALQTGDSVSALGGNGKLNLRQTEILFASDLDSYADDGFTAGQFAFGNSAGVSFSQSDGALRVQYGGGGMGIRGLKKEVGYDGGAFDLEYTVKLNSLPIAAADSAHWRGFVFEMDNTARHRFSLTRDAENNVLFNAGFHTASTADGVSRSVDTGLQVGDTAVIRASVDEEKILRLYVNGMLVANMGKLDWSAGSTHSFFELYCNFAGTETGSLDVEVYDLALVRSLGASEAAIARKLLESLTFDAIKGANASEDMIVSDLQPVNTLSYFGTDYAVTWETSDPEVLTADGKVVGGNYEGESVRYTATVTVGETVSTKTFDLTVYKVMDTEMLYLEDDRNPYTGALLTTGIPMSFTLDQNLNSVGYDLGAVQTVNRVVLTDRDGIHKLHKLDLSLYVSEDNVTFTKVKDFTMANTGTRIYLYNFSAEGRYVKVHCHYESGEAASFTNSLSGMIRAGYETELPGGIFSEIGAVTVKASADGKDAVAYIPYGQLDTDELQPDLRDLRLVLDGAVLPYWLDTDGVYVRLPETVENRALTVKVYGGDPEAESLSDMEAVFEVTYGNKTVQDLTQGVFNGNIAVTEAPNGDILAFGNDSNTPTLLQMRRSTDGGRTWDDARTICDAGTGLMDGGGLLVDHGTIWYMGHYGQRLGAAWDETLKVAILRSDDNGVTWTGPTIVETDYYYHVMYCDGVKTAAYDGAGPEIDYVAGYHFMEQPDSSGFMSSVIYSRDDGATWQTSESKINYALPAGGGEGGVTEAAIAVLSDGTLKMLCRCQYDSVYWLCEATSTDNGLTWSQATASNVTSTNTMPTLKNYGDEIYLLWAGNNIMGGASYQRYPLNLAYSADDMQTWQKKMDLYGGTSLGQYPEPSAWWKNATANLTIEPGMVFTDYAGSEDLVVAWWMNWMKNYVMLIEDADNFLHNTKGAADTFEGPSAKYENWLPGGNYGTVQITDAKAADGRQSLQIVHSTGNQGPVRATRSVPAMMEGEISFDVFLENAATGFYVELKTAYTTAHWTGDRAIFCVDGTGAVKAFDVNTKAATVLGQVQTGAWYEMTLKFDLPAGTAQLYLDGELLGDVPVNMDNTDALAFVQISDGTGGGQLSCYIDNFRAYEGVTAEGTAVVEFVGTSMTLGNDLSVNFILEQAAAADGAYANVTFRGVTQKVDKADWAEDASGGYYKIAHDDLSAKEMTEEITVQIFDAAGNAVSEKKTDSIRSYAMRMLQKDGTEAALKTALVDLLNYGTAAQLFFDYKTEDLANSLLTEEQKAWATASVEMKDIRRTADGYLGTSLELEKNIVLNFYFTAAFVGKTATVTYTDHYGKACSYEAEITANGSMGKVAADKLVIADCSVPVTVTVDGVSVTDSVESYCARMQLPLCEPLMKFATAARAFFQ